MFSLSPHYLRSQIATEKLGPARGLHIHWDRTDGCCHVRTGPSLACPDTTTLTQDFDLINPGPPVGIIQEIIWKKYQNFHHRSLGSAVGDNAGPIQSWLLFFCFILTINGVLKLNILLHQSVLTGENVGGE